jgi:hypothetical protein
VSHLRTALISGIGAVAASAALAGPAAASSPVPLANAVAPDAAFDCISHIPNTPGFRTSYHGIVSASGSINAEDAICQYQGVSAGDRRGFPAGLVTYFTSAINWSNACNLSTSGAFKTAQQAGDRSWWCLP